MTNAARRTRRLTIPALALTLALAPALTLGFPPDAAAAHGLDLVPAEQAAQEVTQSTNVERAMELEQLAAELQQDHARLGRAAQLLRAAADLRDDTDTRKFENLRQAASFNHYAGRDRQAHRDLVSAAELATRQGNVIKAGHVWLDAAWMAKRLGSATLVEHHVEQVRVLSSSPLLDREVRAQLLDRVATLS